MRTLILLLLGAWMASAQLPEFYKTVDRMTWVVGDLDGFVKAWDKTGLVKVEKRQDLESQVELRGKRIREKVRVASGFLGDVRVDWIQPLTGNDAYAEFHKKHGIGIFSLVHRTPTQDEFQRELERLRKAGARVLQQGERYAYLDTEPEGKYVLGLVWSPDDAAAAPPSAQKINQFAFAVHDLKPVSAFWEKMGFAPMAFNQGNLSDLHYRGNPVSIQQAFGWQRGRKVPYEWLQPLNKPNVFDDHMNERGEGIHHLGLPVKDMEKAIGAWKSMGFQVAQSGAWGEAGKKGSGRFAYMDTEAIGGIMIELLWSYQP
jgi:methylmalonyl-CoA/ethylmalonyl-CoA epimerase